MNPLAQELNEIIKKNGGPIYEMLSHVGKNLYYPKGILTQSAEAKEKAHKFNATIGMATEKGKTMHLPSIMKMISGLRAREALTYAPSFGIMPLRKAWKDEIVKKNPSLKEKSFSLPVVSNAITGGLGVVSDMWVDPGDVIVLPDKLWGNYNLIFGVRRGAQILNYPFFDHKGAFNLKAFGTCIQAVSQEKDKIIVILNFPNNPTGYTINPEEGEGIADILYHTARKGTHVLALTDDAYFGLFYEDPILKESIFTKLVDRHPRLLAVKLDGATKENYVWGLRVGFITYGACLEAGHEALYDALEKKTAGAVRGSVSNCSHLSQSIVLKSLEAETYEAEKEEKFRIMADRARTVKEVLKDPKFDEAWDVYPFNSGYFMCIRLKGLEAESLRLHLLEKYGIGLISLGKQDLRIAFSCIEKKDVKELFETIYSGFKELTS
jgi:aspartate/methionine/tyrosine aminotransferase